MFGSLTGFEGGLFDEFRRLQEEIDNLFDQWPATTGVRSVVRGTFPPINVGASADHLEVYLFAAGLDPRSSSFRSSKTCSP
jgi:HSP20 family protein